VHKDLSGLVSSGCERAEGIWKFPFELVPTSWEIVVVDADIRLRNVPGLANVHGPRVVFTVICMIAQWLHAKFRAFRDHNFVIGVTAFNK